MTGAAILPMLGLYPEQAVLACYHLSLWLKGHVPVETTSDMQAVVMQHLADPQRLLPLRAFPTRAMIEKGYRLKDACVAELKLNPRAGKAEEITNVLGVKIVPYQELRPVTMTECLLAAIELGNPLLGVVVCGHYEQVYYHSHIEDEGTLDRKDVDTVIPGLYERLGVPTEEEWSAHARDFLKKHITPAEAAALVRGE